MSSIALLHARPWPDRWPNTAGGTYTSSSGGGTGRGRCRHRRWYAASASCCGASTRTGRRSWRATEPLPFARPSVTRSATPSSVGWSSYRGCGLPSRGAPAPIGALEPANLAVLGILLAELDSRSRDWVAYHRGSVEFHLRNAAAWANEAVGADLARQVDPDFVPGSSTPGTSVSRPKLSIYVGRVSGCLVEGVTRPSLC